MLFTFRSKDLNAHIEYLSTINTETSNKVLDALTALDPRKSQAIERCQFSLSDNLYSEELLRIIKGLAKNTNDTLLSDKADVYLDALIHGHDKPILALQSFTKALLDYRNHNFIKGWVFTQNNAGKYVPLLLSGLRYIPPRGDNNAYVEITLSYSSPMDDSTSRRNGEVQRTLTKKDVYGLSIVDLMDRLGWVHESVTLHEMNNNELDLYDAYYPQKGEQFYLDGMISQPKTSHNDINTLFKKSRVVNNDYEVRHGRALKQRTQVYMGDNGIFDELPTTVVRDGKESKRTEEELEIPFHPYIRIFNLDAHVEGHVFPSQLTPYVYDETVGDKLVLPETHADLLNVLMETSHLMLDDIVANKSGGTAILCQGPAGLGKTLTAEVYSEIMKRPLYMVHSGQLGCNPGDIDKRLEAILSRAARWNAILLLDEADVYIRKRDNNMDHNAIVAAFLRQIERSSTTTFLTTNRSDDVDDAIISRCGAVLTYDYPDRDSLLKIWKNLSENYQVIIPEGVIEKFIQEYDTMSGRDVKEILKLLYRYQCSNRPVDEKLIRYCAIVRGINPKSKA